MYVANVLAFNAIPLCAKGEEEKFCCVQQLRRMYRHQYIIVVELSICQLEGFIVKSHCVFPWTAAEEEDQ